MRGKEAQVSEEGTGCAKCSGIGCESCLGEVDTTKCIVKGCTNQKNEGQFIGDLCFPCHQYLTTGEVGPTDSFLAEMYVKANAYDTFHEDGAGERLPLPPKRYGYTQKCLVGGHKIYFRTGEYPNGRLGEVFIDMHKEGAMLRSVANAFSIAISIGLQHGVPLEEYVDAMAGMSFEPNGVVEMHPCITEADSFLDLVFRDLGIHYLKNPDYAVRRKRRLL